MLAAVVANTTGPVLELGCGNWSTPMLHEICRPTKRPLLSAEDDPEWMKQFTHMETDWHRFLKVDSENAWGQWDFGGGWSVVFVDHGNAAQRSDSILYFAEHDRAQWLVVHDVAMDTDEPCYNYARGFKAWKHVWRYSELWPHTCVLSQHRMWDEREAGGGKE